MDSITSRLQAMAEPEYAAFSCNLLPGTDPETVLGVRVPKLRQLVKSMPQEQQAAFMDTLPHHYHEENLLHALLIAQCRDPQLCLNLLSHFLPYVQNWAVCDTLQVPALKEEPDLLLSAVKEWLKDPHPYTVRFAVLMLMTYFLEEQFSDEFPRLVAEIHSEEYYVNMMAAWYFATALAKQWDRVIGYLERRELTPWVHNKTIQKAVESHRITAVQKDILRKMKIRL